MDFYGDVLVELTTALGAALFFANGFALIRRKADRKRAAREAVLRARPGSPVRGQTRVAVTGDLDQAPLARTVTFMLIGLVAAVWGLASLTS